MRMAGAITGTVVGGSGVALMARVLGSNARPITQASISSVTYAIRDLTDAETDSTGTLTVGSVVFNDLQQYDPRWSKDSASKPGADGAWGYNFLAEFSSTLFNDYDVETESPYVVTPHTYRIDVRFQPVSGQPFVVPFEFTPIPTYV